MAVAFRAANSAITGAVTDPGSAGDYLVALVSNDFGSVPAVPDGTWTQRHQVNVGGDGQTWGLYTKDSSSGTGASLNFNNAGATIVAAFTGVSTSGTLFGFQDDSALTTTTVRSPSVTTTVNGCMLLWLVGIDAGGLDGSTGTTATWTLPTGFSFTKRAQVDSSSANLVLATATQTTAGATGIQSGTCSLPGFGPSGYMVTLAPTGGQLFDVSIDETSIAVTDTVTVDRSLGVSVSDTLALTDSVQKTKNFVGFRSSATSGTGNNATCNKPTGVVSGDLLVALVYYYDNTSASVTPPSGWTSQARIVESTGSILIGEILTKIAGGSEPSSYTFTTGQYTNVAIMAFYTVDSTAPILTPLGNHAVSGVITGLSVTAVRDGSMLILQHVGFGATAPSSPAGMVHQIAALDNVNDAWYQSVNSGATGNKTAGNPSEPWVATMALVQPPLDSALYDVGVDETAISLTDSLVSAGKSTDVNLNETVSVTDSLVAAGKLTDVFAYRYYPIRN